MKISFSVLKFVFVGGEGEGGAGAIGFGERGFIEH